MTLAPTRPAVTPKGDSTEASETFPPRKPVVYERFAPSRVVAIMTRDEYLAFEKTVREKYEFIEGKVVRVAGASYEHIVINSNLTYILTAACREADIQCVILPIEQRVFISDNLYRYPDIAIVCAPPQLDRADSLHNPTALFEILSDSTEREDRTNKFSDYRRIESLQHYLLIAQDAPQVTHFEKEATGSWAIKGEYSDLSESLIFTLDGKTIAVPLSEIYRSIEFAESDGKAASAKESGT